MNLNTGEEVTRHEKITELPITDVIIKYSEQMASRQTTKGIKIQKRDKVIYNPTNWIVWLEYKENDDNPTEPYMPESEAGDYNTGYDKD